MKIRPLIKTKVVWPNPFGQPNEWPTMEGDSLFAKRFNELQRQSWLDTGTVYHPEDLITQILIEKYNDELSTGDE